ncbi:Transcriptional regulator PadR-like family protein [Parasphingorhabdus marina DSM 22363]|uniref:Transcriptional regulator PadR-like family protein n=1 Tax=Parasphingorhabdus marina DSM 22363 TaxID=1123272 RepID=A0A1N6HDT8_9SPHN|nr:PadR family transcriptional regulator [Parasphingorhabdus marina]SIO17896.1 Transcriptional regulator PadR-like family protein [Parasphingorhabdus marina DSM 22363]
MRKARAPSKATRSALISLLNASEGKYGYEIMREAGIGPGTLYPMLARLEDQEILVSRWQEASVEGRPPRHIYELTKTGRIFAQSLVDATHLAPAPQLKPKSA